MKEFILAIQFLTRIPIPIQIDVKDDSFAKGVAYYPLVGVIIGGINLLVYWLTSYIIGGLFPIVCMLFANTCVTGGFHLDGLADTCDGIYSSRTKDRMLEIMKDSRIGSNGVLAIIFDFLFRIVLLSVLPKPLIYFAILLSPVVAKTNVALLITISDYARKKGLAGLYMDHKSNKYGYIAMCIGIIIVSLTLKTTGIIALIFCIILSLLFKKYIYSKIDGMTGDTFGAANEVLEIFFLFLIIVIIKLKMIF